MKARIFLFRGVFAPVARRFRPEFPARAGCKGDLAPRKQACKGLGTVLAWRKAALRSGAGHGVVVRDRGGRGPCSSGGDPAYEQSKEGSIGSGAGEPNRVGRELRVTTAPMRSRRRRRVWHCARSRSVLRTRCGASSRAGYWPRPRAGPNRGGDCDDPLRIPFRSRQARCVRCLPTLPSSSSTGISRPRLDEPQLDEPR